MIPHFIDQRVLLARIGKKVERAAEKMGRLPATGTQTILRCGGRVSFKDRLMLAKKEWVN